MDVQSVSQILHVLMIGSNVQYRSQRFRKFNRKIRVRLTEWYRVVETTGITSVINAVAAIEGYTQYRTIVLSDGYGNIQMGDVAVAYASAKKKIEKINI